MSIEVGVDVGVDGTIRVGSMMMRGVGVGVAKQGGPAGPQSVDGVPVRVGDGVGE